ncbi:carbohydrate ABC transporter permease [Microbacterium sp. 18062]|uniref:carbohydrate ABC transporter permease n=1 Tax=Microbacterium sp. 18062 TaxID=2681410 RepID=UPI00190F842E|nr:carbohydrate ABC transporter permease [Microbacterium sp. 18062]
MSIAVARPGRERRVRMSVTVVSTVLLAVFLFPIYWLVNASLQDGVNSATVTWLPLDFSLEGYARAFSEQLPNIVTSFTVAVGTTVFTLAVALPGAYALSRLRTRIVDAVLVTVFIAQIIPGIVLATGMYSAFARLGILNTHLAIILADTTLAVPFAILILRSFMRGIPEEIFEAVRLDGAGTWRAFVSIVLPLSKNSVITAALFSFLYAWSDLIFAITMSTSSSVRTVTIGIYRYMGAEADAWNAVMASGVLAALPVVLITILAQRSLVDGLTVGSGR